MEKRKSFAGEFVLTILPAYNRPLSGFHAAQYIVALQLRNGDLVGDLFRWEFKTRRAAEVFYGQMPGKPIPQRGRMAAQASVSAP